jgi:hypothetical protein
MNRQMQKILLLAALLALSVIGVIPAQAQARKV